MNYAKKYAKKLKVIDENASLSFYERQDLLRHLNKIVEDLRKEEEGQLKELEDLNQEESKIFKFKYFAPALALNIAMLVAGVVLSSKYPEVTEYKTLKEFSLVPFSYLLPLTMVTASLELTDGITKRSVGKALKRINTQKCEIFAMQKGLKNFSSGSGESLSIIEEDELNLG